MAGRFRLKENFPDAYTERAAKYGEHIKTYRDPELALMMLETLRLKTEVTVLDLACGHGDSSRHLRAIGAEVYYADGNSVMLSQGIKRGLIPKNNARFSSGGAIPFFR